MYSSASGQLQTVSLRHFAESNQEQHWSVLCVYAVFEETRASAFVAILLRCWWVYTNHRLYYTRSSAWVIDDFNTKLLTPDLTKKQLEELHVQALNLHKEYFQEGSFNFIGCSSETCLQFSALIDDIYSVAKLRTSKPLYQAYDFAINQLEGLCLPQFFHSNEVTDCMLYLQEFSLAFGFSFTSASVDQKRHRLSTKQLWSKYTDNWFDGLLAKNCL